MLISILKIGLLSTLMLVILLLSIVWYSGVQKAQGAKISAYECGFEPFGDARDTFEVIFYLVGLLFLIFDIEVAFLFPLVVIIMEYAYLNAVWLILGFSLILSLGLAFEFKLGALDWKTQNYTTTITN